MYSTRFAFRDGHDVIFRFEDYYEARLFLQARGTIYDSDLLYAEITYCGGETCYTTDLIDWRFGCGGRVYSLGDIVSVRPGRALSVPLYGCIDKIDPVDGRVLVSVFDHEDCNGWYGIESVL